MLVNRDESDPVAISAIFGANDSSTGVHRLVSRILTLG